MELTMQIRHNLKIHAGVTLYRKVHFAVKSYPRVDLQTMADLHCRYGDDVEATKRRVPVITTTTTLYFFTARCYTQNTEENRLMSKYGVSGLSEWLEQGMVGKFRHTSKFTATSNGFPHDRTAFFVV